MLEYIIGNSKVLDNNWDKCRYEVPMEHREEYLRQRKYPDVCGNNAIHFVFNLENEE